MIKIKRNWQGPQIDRFLITLGTKKYIFCRPIETHKCFESKGHMGREKSTWKWGNILSTFSAFLIIIFLVTRHASLDYGTVILFCKPVMRNWCQWFPHIFHSARTAWVHLHEREVWSCLYVPPRTSGRMEERRQVVDQYFREWDSAVAQFGP